MTLSVIASNSRAAQGQNAEITHGFTLADNDFLVVYINRNDSTNIDSAGGGEPWTEQLQETPPTGETASHAIFRKQISNAAGEPAQYSFDLSSVRDYQILIYQVRSSTGANIVVDSPPVTGDDDSSVFDLECKAPVGRTASANAISFVFGGKDRSVPSVTAWTAVSGGFTGIEGVGAFRLSGGAYKIHSVQETFASDIIFTSNSASGSDTSYSMHVSFIESGGGGATPVTNTLGLNWNSIESVSGSSSFVWGVLTNVSAQLNVDFDLLNSVLSSSELAWAVVQNVESQASLEWSILNAVSNSVDIDWDALNFVLSSTELQFQIFNSVSGELSINWNTLSSLTQVVSTIDIDWGLLQAVSSTASIDWSILANVSNGAELRFGVLNQVSKNLGLNWDLVVQVGQSVDLLWDSEQAAGSVSRTLSLDWSILSQVQAALDQQWQILESVSVSKELRFNIAQAVQNEISANWSILTGVEKSLTLNFDSLAVVAGNIELNWSVQTEQVRLPVFQMIVKPSNKIMTVAASDRVMTIN